MIEEIRVNTLEAVARLILDQERNESINRYRSAYFYRGLPNTDYHLDTSLRRNCKELRKKLEPIILSNFTKYAIIEDPSLSGSVCQR